MVKFGDVQPSKMSRKISVFRKIGTNMPKFKVDKKQGGLIIFSRYYRKAMFRHMNAAYL